MQRQILLKTENLSKTFSNGGRQQHVLKNIDLELYQGDFTVIMGASGAGKSTLLYALSGMDTPTLGKITFGDKVISDLSQDGLAVFRRDHCGFVFQQIYLIDGMSVMDNVLSAGLLVNKDKKALVAKAKELFETLKKALLKKKEENPAEKIKARLVQESAAHIQQTVSERNRRTQHEQYVKVSKMALDAATMLGNLHLYG